MHVMKITRGRSTIALVMVSGSQGAHNYMIPLTYEVTWGGDVWQTEKNKDC